MAGRGFRQFSFFSKDTYRSPMSTSSSKGNIMTIQENIQMICQSPFPLRQKCYDLEYLLQQSSSKELFLVFPYLLDDIFGYNGHRGWDLHHLQTSNMDDFFTLSKFLAPEGAVFHGIYKLQGDPYLKFDFPVANLPNQVKDQLERGIVPPFYQNKLNKSMTHVQMNPFEYFLFNFAYFVVCPANQKIMNNWVFLGECFYPTLLDQYLNVFLPLESNRIIPPIPATLSSTTRSQSSGHSPTNRLPQYGVLFDYLQSGNRERSPLIRDEASSFYHMSSSTTSLHSPHSYHGTGSTGGSDGETWCSEVLVQILVDFWLKQNTITAQNKSLFRQVQENFIPSLDHVRAVRILIKHLHFFANSAKRDMASSPYKSSQDSALDELKRIIIQLIVQKPLYVFLRHGFDHWPMDVTFRMMLEVWLSYIQPWRYITDGIFRKKQPQDMMLGMSERSPLREQRSIHFGDERWTKFIAENVPMYTVLFQEFVPRVLRQDLSNAKNALMIFRVAKVFKQLHLAQLLKEGESQLMEILNPNMLDKSYGSNTSYHPSLPSSHQGFHQQNLQILDLEGPEFMYEPLFGDVWQYQISQLLQVINQAKSTISSLKRSHLYDLGDSLSSWLNLDSWFTGFNSVSSHASLADDIGPMNTHKAGLYLDQTSNFLAETFEVEPPIAVDTSSTQDPFSDNNRDLPPETSEDGKLTERGRYQVANGYRRLDVQYLGDPDLQPIRTYENATLVRFLYNFSCVVNEKYGDFIQAWYNRTDFRGSIAKQFFKAPAISPKRQRVPSSFVSCRVDHTPRLSLRFLASYQTIGYFLALLFLAYLFGFSTIGFIFIVLMCILLYGIIGGAVQYMRQDSGDTLRNHGD